MIFNSSELTKEFGATWRVPNLAALPPLDAKATLASDMNPMIEGYNAIVQKLIGGASLDDKDRKFVHNMRANMREWITVDLVTSDAQAMKDLEAFKKSLRLLNQAIFAANPARATATATSTSTTTPTTTSTTTSTSTSQPT